MNCDKDGGAIMELRFHCGIDLPKALYSTKLRPYVMAGIVKRDSKSNWAETSMSNIDKEHGENPKWDFVIQCPLNQEMLHMATNFNLIAKIMHYGTSLLRDRKIGYVVVGLPKLLLLAGSAAGEYITETYPVVSSSAAGKEERGRIVISHKLIDFFNTPTATTYVPYSLDDHNPILELFFHGGIDLRRPYISDGHKARPYMEAAIDRSDTKPNWFKTVSDKNGGEKPVWNYMIHFPLNQEMVRMPVNFYLFCNIMHAGKKLGDRQIGKVKVCLQDLLATGENISYQVEASSDGGKKGEIVISHRLITNTTTAGISAPPPVGVQDRNHRAAPKVVNRIKIAARLSTIGAAIVSVVTDLT